MRILKKAKRVFKGQIFDIYQWRQKMFDGSFATFEMLKRPGTVQILPIYRGKILVTSETQPNVKRYLGLLGGRIDEGETPLACAKRELMEEAGLESKDWQLLEVNEPHVKMDWKVYYFIARNCEKVAQPQLDEGERIKIRAVNFNKFIQLMSSGEYQGGEFVSNILRMRLKPKRLDEFRKKLFNT